MPETLKKFAAVFAECTGPECRIITIEFHIEDEDDALEVAEEIALLDGNELIYVFRVLEQSEQYGRCEDCA